MTTVVGLFAGVSEAQRVTQTLVAQGVPSEAITMQAVPTRHLLDGSSVAEVAGHVSAVLGEARMRVFISPGIVVPFGPVWTPYAEPYAYPYRYPYAYPPVVVQPPPQVYVQPPPPPPMWYYCENPQGYYPYVPQCPGGWRQVPATPP